MSDLRVFFILHRFQISNFESLYFLLFLILSVLVYYIFKKSTLVLLLTGILFYATYSAAMAHFLFFITFTNYFGGIILAATRSKLLLVLLIMLDAGSLIYYKYTNFFIGNLHNFNLATNFDTLSYLVIPLGISFFTFETIHYVVDVYKGNKPVINPIKFFTFIFFFPTIIAGPIKRFEKFIPQLGRKKIDYDLILNGVLLIIRGLFKKIVIANGIASFANYGYDATSNSTIMLIGIYAFTLQIFFDFSGYTDIARGSAALFGLKIPENFLSPYLSSSMREFWRRWNITLMNWLRDYIYIPLGGSRKGKARHMINLIIVFLVSGLWHGAAWHYVIWGLYNSLLIIVSIFLFKKPLIKFNVRATKILNVLITFNLVTFGWILFRADSMQSAWKIFTKILALSNYHLISGALVEKMLFLSIPIFVYIVSPLLLAQIKDPKAHSLARYAVYSLAIIVVALSFQTEFQSFIYFQF